jgi:hypothetical protein
LDREAAAEADDQALEQPIGGESENPERDDAGEDRRNVEPKSGEGIRGRREPTTKAAVARSRALVSLATGGRNQMHGSGP